MDVEFLDDVFPATPTVVARLDGGEPGPSVVLCAHLDTVPIPHDPPRIEGDRVYGRGSADMKGAAVCALEAAQVLAESGPFKGELVLVLIGLHEAPGGRGEDLTHLLTNRASPPTTPSSARCRATTSASRTWARRRPRSRSRGRACRRTSCRRRPTRRIRCTPRRRWSRPSTGGARSWPRSSTRGSAPRRTSSARCTAATSTTAGPRAAASSARAAGRPATRSRRSRPSTARCSTRSRAETGCDIDLDLRLVRGAYEIDFEHELSRALREAYAEVTGKPARAGRQEGRRRRGGLRGRRDPDRLPRPGRLGRARGRRVHGGAGARARDRGLPRAAAEALLSDPGWMPSRAFAERYPNLLAIGGHPAVDMPPHVVEAAARAAERPAYAPTLGAPGAPRGDRRAAHATSSAGRSTRSRTCSSRSAACRGSTSRRSASARTRSATRRRSSSRRSSPRPAARAR